MRGLSILLCIGIFWGGVYAQPSLEWQYNYGGSDYEVPNLTKPTLDNGFIIAGYSMSSDGHLTSNNGGYDIWLVKIDSLGTIQWQKNYGGSADDYPMDILQNPDGSYVLAGYTISNDIDFSSNNGMSDAFLMKVDNSGNIIWVQTYGGTDNDDFYSIDKTSDGGYIAVGATQSNDIDISGNNGVYDILVIKVDSLGNILWQKCLGGSEEDYGNAVYQTSDGGYAIAGYSNSSDGDIAVNNGLYDVWFVKLDSTGTIEWEQAYGGSGWDDAFDMGLTADGGYILIGSSESTDGDVTGNNGDFDYWVIKLYSWGSIEWEGCFGGSGFEEGHSVQQTFSGGYILNGVSNSTDGDLTGNYGDNDYWTVKLGPSGTIEWQLSLGGSSMDWGQHIYQTPDTGYIVTGVSESDDGLVGQNFGGYDYWIVKLASDPQLNIHEIKVPSKKDLYAYPNPFNSSVIIQTPTGSRVEIFDITGRLVDEIENTGIHSVLWTPSEKLPSGIYLIRAINNINEYYKKVIYTR